MKMKKMYKQIVVAMAAFAMVVTPTAQAASYTFEISGNGADSDSEIEFERENSTEVFQNNTSTIQNNIQVKTNTGGNDLNDNTGGNVELRTGDVSVATEIVNQVNANQANVVACDCDTDVDVKVAGNGADSRNEVEIENESKNTVVQNNLTSLQNQVKIAGDTGYNDLNDNTGGDVYARTGNVMIAPVAITNMAGSNTAMIGGQSNGGSELALKVIGNGADSKNEIEVENEQENGLYQNNLTQIGNDLYLKGRTGKNDLNFNTGPAGSDPALLTGDVWIGAMVHNEAGFNYANADCGCVLDVMGSINGNGADSRNEIELELEDETVVKQDNADVIYTNGNADSDTGSNDLDDNTGGDVEARTGNTETLLSVMTFGGFNGFGVEVQWPWD